MTKQLEALIADWKFYAGEAQCHPDPNYCLEFEKLSTPANVLAMIAALEQAQQYAKQRDSENQDLMLTIGRLRVEREQLEVSPSAVKLPVLASIHSNWSGEYLLKSEVIEAIRAAGGAVEGE